jgi:uncharacterized membrane protein
MSDAGNAARAPESLLRRALRYVLSGLFLTAGTYHFATPEAFIAIVPADLPRPDLLVAISGAAELVLGLALFVEQVRVLAALLLMLLMLAVWPANWNMALHAARFDAFTPLQLWLRVVLQLPMLFWAAYAGGLWPKRERSVA